MNLRRLPARLAALVALAAIFVIDLVRASISVARIVLARRPTTHPAIVAVPVDLETRGGVAAFASFLSLTPGSVALHVADDRRTIYVHLLDARDPAASVAGFKRDFERWIGRVER